MSLIYLSPPPLIPGDSQTQNSQVNNDLKVYGDFSCGSMSLDTTGTGSGFFVKETGIYAKQGTTVLASGTATVGSTNGTFYLPTNARIFLSNQQSGGTVGFLYVGARNTAGQFVIQSASNTDASTVAWLITSPTS